MRSLRFSILASAVLALAAACGGGTAATQGPAATPGGVATQAAGGNASQISCNDGGAGTPAEIFDNGFRPIPVAADADKTVTWTNTGNSTHNVTFDNGGPDCGELANAETLSVLFPGAGSYAYHCRIHPSMVGTVTVS